MIRRRHFLALALRLSNSFPKPHHYAANLIPHRDLKHGIAVEGATKKESTRKAGPEAFPRLSRT